MLLELLSKLIRQRSPLRKAGKCMYPEHDGCIVDPLVDNAIESCEFTGTPRKMNLPDLNKHATVRMSPRNTSISQKPSVARIIHRFGPTGGSVSGTKLDDLSVSTFPTCCTSVLATVDKHAFPLADSDHIRGCDLNNSSSVARDCNLLHCTDSSVCAKSSTVDNENFVHCDVAAEVT